MALRLREKAEQNGEVIETMIERTYDGMTPNQREAVDKFLTIACGADYITMTRHGETLERASNAHAENRLEDLSTRQRIDLFTTFDYMDIFIEEMKDRWAQKTREGRQGYDGKEIVLPVHDEIANRLGRVKAEEPGIGIGIANWGFISWFRETLKK
jgi:hypothetical protein